MGLLINCHPDGGIALTPIALTPIALTSIALTPIALTPIASATGATRAAAHPPPPREDLTRLLLDWSSGDPDALERLVPLVYDDLRRLAQSYLERERPGHTLQATAVVHELYVGLAKQKRIRWQNRAQFFAVAATLMRRLLVSHARKKRSAKRGGGAVALALDEALNVPEGREPDLLALDEALQVLAEFAPRQSRIVEMRFFGGLTVDETAAVLDVSPATVKLDWSLAKAWLFRELNQG
jgi:RNA polymerase sigma factor (TIGR02999 family)